MSGLIKREPVAFFGGLQAIILPVIGLLVAFNAWNPTELQTTALLTAYSAVTGFVTWAVRASVTPYAGGPLTPVDDD